MASADALGARRVRAAHNQSLFRRVNERIDKLNAALTVAEAPRYVCECLRLECADVLVLSHLEYERVRSYPTHFVIVPGHEDAEVESVVQRTDWYLIVQKLGEGAEAAAASDPRK